VLRVIAGEKGGRRLVAPEGRRTRPTSDRVREAAFSMLESLLAQRGGLFGLVAWDLFAGSGALGIEALSRGASSVVFVDSARAAVSATQANLARLGYGPGKAEVVQADVLRWAHGLEGRLPPCGPDLTFADPPYAWRSWPALLGALAPHRPLVVMESGDEPELPEGWRAVKARRYGGTLVTLAENDDRKWADASSGRAGEASGPGLGDALARGDRP
jgi:16S rRNA (guanine966-N2)-methyltransferase